MFIAKMSSTWPYYYLFTSTAILPINCMSNLAHQVRQWTDNITGF